MDILWEAFAALSYGAVGLGLMALGIAVVDLITPGNLRKLIWEEHRLSAAIVLSSALLSVSLIIWSATRASDYGLGWGLIMTGVYGVIGLILMAAAFLILDLMTPGKLSEMVVADRVYPATWVVASLHIAVGIMVSAAIS